MAFAFTVTGKEVLGSLKLVYGTFTSAEKDNTATLDATTHGLNLIVMSDITLNRVYAQRPLVSASSGTLTVTWDETHGSSGTWAVLGK